VKTLSGQVTAVFTWKTFEEKKPWTPTDNFHGTVRVTTQDNTNFFKWTEQEGGCRLYYIKKDEKPKTRPYNKVTTTPEDQATNNNNKAKLKTESNWRRQSTYGRLERDLNTRSTTPPHHYSAPQLCHYKPHIYVRSERHLVGLPRSNSSRC
jgi:hypothetical protein